jgi:acyl-phosphate glycerol 3-phosphate acyltransferase
MNPLSQVLCIILGYAIGAFPTAMLLARTRGVAAFPEQPAVTSDQPISALWSRTRQDWTTIVTAAIDIAKGFLAVHVGMALAGGTFLAPALTGFFAILGHNYNFFVKARYGRGIPVMAGVVAAINPVPLAIFFVCWLTGFFVIRRNYYVGLMTAIFATPILVYTAPELLVRTFMRVPLETISQFTVFVVLLAAQVLVRHIEPLREVFNTEGEEE